MSHPIHPALVHFPVACWSLGSLADLGSIYLGENTAEVAALLISAGLILSLPTMLTGLLDLSKLKGKTLAQDVVMTHITYVLIAWLLYAATLYLRTQHEGVLLYLAPSILGFICLSFAGWYGGKLVYTHGIGVKAK